MAKEIEYKYIATWDKPDFTDAGWSMKLYQQAYLTTKNPEVRIRRTMRNSLMNIVVPGSYFMAVKSGSGLVREEIEFSVSDDDGYGIFQMISPNHVIHKARYHYNGWEIDNFEGRLSGLVIAEVELDDENDVVPDPPEGVLLLKDVTHVAAFKCKALSRMTQLDLQHHLDQQFSNSSVF